MKLDIGTDLNQWVRKLIYPRKFNDTHQAKVVDDGHKSFGEKDVVSSKDEVDAKSKGNEKAKKVPFENLKGALSQGREVLKDVTPSFLRLVICSTLKSQSAEATHSLVIRGEHNSFLKKPLSARKLKSLGKACPSLRQLAIEDLNLSTSARRKRIALGHFPTTLCLLSIRDSAIEVAAFLKPTRDFYNIKVLDRGRSLDARLIPVIWPHMANIEELYLEGTKGFESAEFLQTILVNCPLLKFLDLEGTELAQQVESLFLGFTNMRDSDFSHLEHLKMNFILERQNEILSRGLGGVTV